MESIFLSYSFSKPEDRFIVVEIEDLLRSMGIRLITGLNLGGNQLTDEVKSLIKQSDGLIAITSRRDQLASGNWVTHPWVLDEFSHAKSIGVNAIALVENGVSINGAYKSHEHIPFERQELSPALLKLAKTLGIWKEKSGNRLKVRLLPDGLLENLQSPSCQYQFITRGDCLGWNDVKPILEPGGTYIHLDGVRDDYLIEVKVSSPNGVLTSPATAQTMPIIMR